MHKILVGAYVALFAALPIRCDMHTRGTVPSFEEMQMCAKIGDHWYSSVRSADAEDWYYVKKCEIRYDRERKPTDLLIHLVAPLELDAEREPLEQCKALRSALEDAVQTVMNATVSVDATIGTSRSTCADLRLDLVDSSDSS